MFWSGRQGFFVGSNMFIYFSLEQVRKKDFRGLDVSIVLGVPNRERKSWVVWEEKKGPDVVIELLSKSTAAADKGANICKHLFVKIRNVRPIPLQAYFYTDIKLRVIFLDLASTVLGSKFLYDLVNPGSIG